jgi:hypothetical protein
MLPNVHYKDQRSLEKRVKFLNPSILLHLQQQTTIVQKKRFPSFATFKGKLCKEENLIVC